MVECSQCHEQVLFSFLRQPQPRCERDHELGRWVRCGKKKGRHLYINPLQGDVCPICGNREVVDVELGTLVRCLHISREGKSCISPRYKWMVDGPPCYMNHLDQIQEEEPQVHTAEVNSSRKNQ